MDAELSGLGSRDEGVCRKEKYGMFALLEGSLFIRIVILNCLCS